MRERNVLGKGLQVMFWGIAGVLLGFVVLVQGTGVARAEEQSVPYRINFQGRLSDDTGNSMPSGTYNMKFRIYTADTAGTLLWSGQRSVSDGTGVTVNTGGLFSVQLGRISTMPAELFSNPELYFEIELPTPATVRCATAGCESYTEGPMSPRHRFLSSPYAFNADQLDGLDSTMFGQLASDNAWTGNSNAFGGSSFVASPSTNATISSPSIAFTTPQSGITLNGANVSLSGTSFTDTATSTLFQNSSNSASAFTIARAGSGGSMFVVDTANSRVYVGNPTADASAVLLVVDNVNSATDPVGTNGAIYYNTSMGTFRCYQDDAWADCVSKEKIVVSTDDQTATSNTTSMQNVSGMTVPLDTNSTYMYEVMFVVNVSSTSADMRYTLTSPSGSTLSGVGTATTGSTGQSACTLLSSSGTTCSVATSTAARTVVTIRGTVETSSAAGSLQLRFAQNTATASVSSPTALAGSTIRYQKLY